MREPSQREAELYALFEHAPIPIALADLSPLDTGGGRIVRLNDALAQLIGRSRSALVGLPLERLFAPEDRMRVWGALAAGAREGVTTRECNLVRADETLRPVMLSATRIPGDAGGEPTRAVLQFLDLSRRRATELELRRLAERDPLTDLLNRRSFIDHLDDALAYSDRYGTRGAVLVLDVDDLKSVNDRLGHYAGDQLLTQIASFLGRRLRKTDILARLGGDEFAILLAGADARRAQAVAHGLVEALSEHNFVLGGRALRVTVSIGSATLPAEKPFEPEELMARADAAMYEAKRAGRAAARSFELHQPPHAPERSVAWLERLRDALEHEGFDLVAQPIMGIESDDDDRAELLLRLPDPRGGAIRPGAFLPLAERHNLIQEIDRWVLGRAMALIGERERAGRPLTVHVNLSGKTFTDPGLPDALAALAEREGVEHVTLAIELSEGAAVGELDRAQEAAARLRSLGCELVLDEFGSGFFAFPSLKELPFDLFKISGAYIERIGSSATDRLIVRALSLLAKGVGARTIAQWVESERALEMLAELEIDYGQGFHLGPPVSLDAVG